MEQRRGGNLVLNSDGHVNTAQWGCCRGLVQRLLPCPLAMMKSSSKSSFVVYARSAFPPRSVTLRPIWRLSFPSMVKRSSCLASFEDLDDRKLSCPCRPQVSSRQHYQDQESIFSTVFAADCAACRPGAAQRFVHVHGGSPANCARDLAPQAAHQPSREAPR